MNCTICAQSMTRLLNLPRFPLTEKYEPYTDTFEEGRGFVDQAFMYCEDCSHGALETVVPDLYGGDYRTSTGASAGALNAVRNFAQFIKDNTQEREYHIDIGGNDGSMKAHFDNVIVVDPHAKDDPHTIDSFDFSPYRDEPKIIMSSHTIEHLVDPSVMIAKCAAAMGDDDYLALQFPSLELLVEDARIDQIHHQHLHYFSAKSIEILLQKHGLHVHQTRFDPSHWGALMVIAKREDSQSVCLSWIQTIDVQNAIRTFQNLEIHVPRGTLALGAALMLPVLAYWFPELDAVCGIYDQDKSKEGLRYINFDKRISSGWLIQDQDVVITAIGSKTAARALTKLAINAGARRIILPLHTL